MPPTLAALCTFALAALLTLMTRRAAYRLGFVAAPRKDRWHQKPTALMGGVAIYAAFAVGYVVFLPDVRASLAVLAGGTLLFVTGLVDDRYPIKPYAKLVLQLIAAAIVVYSGLHLPWVNYEWVNDFLTIFWLVGITNAINLLDNMDGLAAGIAVISCAFLVLTFLMNGQPADAVLPALLGGAALGFLVFNFSPATIFMGDCGSMFLGFMLSGTALLNNTARFRSLTSVLLTPVLILLLPIFDTCMVTVTRKLSGRPMSQGGRDHTSHRLVALGVSERRAVLMLYLFAAVSGALALMVRLLETTVVLALVPAFALMVLGLGLYLGKVRVTERPESLAGPRLLIRFAESPYKRRVVEVLLDVTLIALAYYGAYVLRWDGRLPGEQLAIFIKTLPLIIIVQTVSLLVAGVYRGLWHYFGVADLLVSARGIVGGGLLSAAVVFVLYDFHGPSRAVFLLDVLLLVVLVSASRLAFRLFRQGLVGSGVARPDARPVLIYGAGAGGELLFRELLNNNAHAYAPVGFIDDDATKAGRLLHGVRIFGSHQLNEVVRTHGVREVLISSLKVPENQLDSIRRLGLDLKKMSIRIE
jgi:UDP-GlcNAc:undecaprenyl-phosphate/decaprenyl-phosphate GlcNAc-1-phosphate transferase